MRLLSSSLRADVSYFPPIFLASRKGKYDFRVSAVLQSILVWGFLTFYAIIDTDVDVLIVSYVAVERRAEEQRKHPVR